MKLFSSILLQSYSYIVCTRIKEYAHGTQMPSFYPVGNKMIFPDDFKHIKQMYLK